MARKRVPVEVFCCSCERLLSKEEQLGQICPACFRKARSPLMRAAIHQVVVAVVPIVCPHDIKGHHCRTRFQVLVLDKNLSPKEITGPYSMSAAERRADSIRKRIERWGK